MPDAFSTYLSSGGAVYFTNYSVNSDRFSWDFGDESPSSFEREPVHHYSAEGIYNVKLIVANASYCIDSMDIMIVVVDDLGPMHVYTGYPNRVAFNLSTQSGRYHLLLKPGELTSLQIQVFGMQENTQLYREWNHITDLDFQLPTDDFPEGVYLVKIRAGNEPELTFKLIR